MIFRVTMKDPDTLYDAINEALDDDLKATGLSEEEQEAIRDIRHEKIADVANEWFDMGEYLTVEIDTELKTIRVVPVKETM